MSHVYGNYTTEGLTHRLKLRSAYSAIGELPFTNYTPGFKGVIDYIWYSANALNVTNLLGPVDEDYINKQVVGFPNAHFPSDHLRASDSFGHRADRLSYPGGVPGGQEVRAVRR